MAKKKSKKQLYMEKEPNNYMKLRYREGDNPHAYPSMSIDEFSKTRLDKLSKGIISKLESNDYDPKNPPCNASTLRLYHDKCGCSFDYLMGETNYKTPELNDLGKDPVFSQLDESFWNNLRKFLTDGYGNEAMLLNVLFSNPEKLQDIFDAIFKALLRINNINKLKFSKELKETVENNIGIEEFSLNRTINRYLEDTILPLLESEFYVYENDTSPRLDNATSELINLFGNYCNNSTKETTD